MRSKKIFSYFSIFIVLTGILVRCIVYLQNRSLFIDEANLARNFVEKSYAEFLTPLSYYQYSPPVFSFIEKWQTQLWGVHEYALRLFPVLCSIATLYIFYQLCTRLIDNLYLRWFPLWLIAFSDWFIRYGTEVKQYSSDILLGVLLPYLALREKGLSWWSWALIGIFAVWLSMSSVFFLAGVGFYFLIKNYVHAPDLLQIKERSRFSNWSLKKHPKLWHWLLIILIWLINFGFYYFLILRPNVTSSDLQSYHTNYFLPLIPTHWADFILIKDLFLSIIKTGYGFTIPAYVTGIGGIILFGYWSKQAFSKFYKDTPAAINSININLLLGLPILLCLLASTLHFYSLIPRLILFFIPALILISTIGWAYFFKTINRYGQVVILFLMIITAGLQTGFRYGWQPLQIEEIKPLLEVLRTKKQAQDYIYIFHEAEGAYRFYTSQHVDNQRFTFKNEHIAAWNENPDQLLQKENPQQMWLLYTHLLSATSEAELVTDLEHIKKYGSVELVTATQGGKLFLYKKKSLIPTNETSDFRQK